MHIFLTYLISVLNCGMCICNSWLLLVKSLAIMNGYGSADVWHTEPKPMHPSKSGAAVPKCYHSCRWGEKDEVSLGEASGVAIGLLKSASASLMAQTWEPPCWAFCPSTTSECCPHPKMPRSLTFFQQLGRFLLPALCLCSLLPQCHNNASQHVYNT